MKFDCKPPDYSILPPPALLRRTLPSTAACRGMLGRLRLRTSAIHGKGPVLIPLIAVAADCSSVATLLSCAGKSAAADFPAHLKSLVFLQKYSQFTMKQAESCATPQQHWFSPFFTILDYSIMRSFLFSSSLMASSMAAHVNGESSFSSSHVLLAPFASRFSVRSHSSMIGLVGTGLIWPVL